MGMMNVVLLFSLICFLILHGYRHKTALPKTILLVTVIWLLNAAFTIFSSPAAIRLQAFPIILETTFALVLVDWLWKLAVDTELANSLNSKIKPQEKEIPAKMLA